MTRLLAPDIFSRPLKVDRVPRGGSFEKISADPGECRGLAARLAVPAVHGLNAELRVSPWRGGGLKLEGALRADLEQISVISLEAFRQALELPVLRYFLQRGATAQDDVDSDVIENGFVDLGEVVTETLALELPPYPRKPGEVFADPVGAPGEEAKPDSPFAVLNRHGRL